MDVVLRNFIMSQPAPARPEDLTDERIKRYNDEQLRWYTAMLNNKSCGIRFGEVREYLIIHRSIRQHGHQWDKLNNIMKSEILDCFQEEFGD